MTVKLGDRVKDILTGMRGVVIGETNWMFGCRRLTVQPEGQTEDGKPFETFCVDEPQLVVTKSEAFAPTIRAYQTTEKTHGPRDDARRRADVKRGL